MAYRHLIRREGEYWTIVFDGALFRLQDGKGIRYLAYLLSHPDQRIACGDLWSTAGGCSQGAASSAERARLAVTKRIRASIAKIATLCPALANHLSSRIRTGYSCVYLGSPRRPTSWQS